MKLHKSKKRNKLKSYRTSYTNPWHSFTMTFTYKSSTNPPLSCHCDDLKDKQIRELTVQLVSQVRACNQKHRGMTMMIPQQKLQLFRCSRLAQPAQASGLSHPAASLMPSQFEGPAPLRSLSPSPLMIVPMWMAHIIFLFG